MKILYITVSAPYGKGESFVLSETNAMRQAGHSVLIAPVQPERQCYVPGYDVWAERLFTFRVLWLAAQLFVRHPLLCLKTVCRVLLQSGNLNNLLRNLIIIPKSLATAQWLRGRDLDCIHVHWMSTPATMAFIISIINKIPCVATAHRWDIYCKNAPIIKTQHFSAIRVINERGKKDFSAMLPQELRSKVHLIHMGIDIPVKMADLSTKRATFDIAVAANLNLQKGHAYILKALKMLKDAGKSDIILHFFGRGMEEAALKEQAFQLGVSKSVVFYGHIPHAELLEKYATRDFDCVMLASYEVNGIAYEGIPICLIEAMAYEIPVIATDSGGIPELVSNDCGILIPQKDSEAIAGAISRIQDDKEYARKIATKGRLRVEQDFDNKMITARLVRLMNEAKTLL